MGSFRRILGRFGKKKRSVIPKAQRELEILQSRRGQLIKAIETSKGQITATEKALEEVKRTGDKNEIERIDGALESYRNTLKLRKENLEKINRDIKST